MPSKKKIYFSFLYPDPGAPSNFRQRILKKKLPKLQMGSSTQSQEERKGQDYNGEGGRLFK